VAAPLAVNVLERPRDASIEGLAEADTTGDAFTTTVALAVLDTPDFVPVQEYVVVDDGLTVILAVVSPVLHK